MISTLDTELKLNPIFRTDLSFEQYRFSVISTSLRPLYNSFFRHSGLPSSAVAMLRRVDDPESRKSLKVLDPPVNPGDDVITTFVMFCKGIYI
jgi:hypothetical protein